MDLHTRSKCNERWAFLPASSAYFGFWNPELGLHDNAGGAVISDRSEGSTYIDTYRLGAITITSMCLSSTTVGSVHIEREGSPSYNMSGTEGDSREGGSDK